MLSRKKGVCLRFARDFRTHVALTTFQYISISLSVAISQFFLEIKSRKLALKIPSAFADIIKLREKAKAPYTSHPVTNGAENQDE
jgi:hypothetical protein